MKSQQKIATVCVVALLVIIISMLLFFLIYSPKSQEEQKDQGNSQQEATKPATDKVEVCIAGNYPNGVDYYECEKRDTIEIIRGSDKITSNYDEECQKLGGTPYFEVVGGFVGRAFKGCVSE